jgi:hypothetical protein
MRGRLVLAATAIGLGVRLVRSRSRRSLHPAGRSFAGDLEIWGADPPIGSALADRPGRYPVTVRVSKGIGTRGDRPDVLGLAVRIPAGGGDVDILLSTAGRGRIGRHVPMPRRGFDTWYGSITAYRAGDDRKVYLGAGPDPDTAPLGRTLAAVTVAARRGAGVLLYAATGGTTRSFGRVSLGTALPPATDAALAFDPVGNAPVDLHPTGLLHASRAVAYRLSQRWRGVPSKPVRSPEQDPTVNHVEGGRVPTVEDRQP